MEETTFYWPGDVVRLRVETQPGFQGSELDGNEHGP